MVCCCVVFVPWEYFSFFFKVTLALALSSICLTLLSNFLVTFNVGLAAFLFEYGDAILNLSTVLLFIYVSEYVIRIRMNATSIFYPVLLLFTCFSPLKVTIIGLEIFQLIIVQSIGAPIKLFYKVSVTIMTTQTSVDPLDLCFFNGTEYSSHYCAFILFIVFMSYIKERHPHRISFPTQFSHIILAFVSIYHMRNTYQNLSTIPILKSMLVFSSWFAHCYVILCLIFVKVPYYLSLGDSRQNSSTPHTNQNDIHSRRNYSTPHSEKPGDIYISEEKLAHLKRTRQTDGHSRQNYSSPNSGKPVDIYVSEEKLAHLRRTGQI